MILELTRKNKFSTGREVKRHCFSTFLCPDSSSFTASTVCFKRHYWAKMVILIGLLIYTCCLPSFSNRNWALEGAAQPLCQTWYLYQRLPPATARMLDLPLYILGTITIPWCLFQSKKNKVNLCYMSVYELRKLPVACAKSTLENISMEP